MTPTAYALDHTFARLPIELTSERDGDTVTIYTVSAPSSRGVELVLPCAIDEHFVGGGEQFMQLDKRGRIIEALVGPTVNALAHHTKGLDGGYKVAPLFYSSAGYAAYVEGTRHVHIEFAVRSPHEVVIRSMHPELRVVVIDGMPAEAIEIVTQRTGRPPLAPPWAYGVWHGIRGGDANVREEAARLRDQGVGCSAIWLDAHYQPSTNSGFPASGTYELGEYPDMSSTVAALHDLGLKALTYVNPYLYANTPCFEEAMAKGYVIKDASGEPIRSIGLHPFEGDALGVLGDTGIHSLENGVAFIDFTNPDARSWWKGLLSKILLDEGFDGWMEDFGEHVPGNSVMHDGTLADQAHNRYPLLYHEASLEAINESKPDALQFCRGGWLGAQQFGKVFWPGDQSRDWSYESGLACLPPAGISIGLMGVAAWGSDIGANMGFPSLGGGLGGGSQDRELWIRWCQMGAMSPVMRDHLSFHDGIPVDLWTDEETVDTWRRCAAWHIGLFPYLYSAAHEASATGMPILRGMMLQYPHDPEAWTLGTQYLLGDALLCAPVLDKGATTRKVYLPQDEWIDCWTGQAYLGGEWVDVPAPLDQWPHLQRAGTVVAAMANVPLDLNDPSCATGAFDLELRATAGAEQRTLFDGTTLHLNGGSLEVRSPHSRRVVSATPDGRVIDEATGSAVTLRVK